MTLLIPPITNDSIIGALMTNTEPPLPADEDRYKIAHQLRTVHPE
jgi:hypothetical protein